VSSDNDRNESFEKTVTNNDDRIIFSKLNNLFEEKKCLKIINKHINNKTVKDKIKEVINIINKISMKETEKTKSYLEIVKIIPSNDENKSDIFFLDVITSFIYYEACEEKVIQNDSMIKCDDINILSKLFNILLERIESYKRKHHKLLMLIISLFSFDNYEFPSKEFNLSPLIHELLNTSKKNIIKKFQYPILRLIYRNMEIGIEENRIYLLSKLFNNDLTNIIKLIFDFDDLISEMSGNVIYYMIEFDSCFNVLIKNETIEKIISIIENEERKERINNDIEIKIDKDNSCDISKDVTYEMNKSRVLKYDHTIPVLLRSLEKLIRFTDISSLLKTINKEQIKSLSKVVDVYFYSFEPFIYFPSIISLILNYLITKNFRDDEEEEFILEIEEILLFSWEEIVDCLIKKSFVTNLEFKYRDVPLDFFLMFLLFGGLWIITNVFYKFKHFYNSQHFSFTKYESLEINTMITNFIKDFLKEEKLITFFNICDTVFESYKQNINELRIFEPLIFYLFILKRTLNLFIYFLHFFQNIY
jgi:hypothetical protein